jgi:hypothetical protein
MYRLIFLNIISKKKLVHLSLETMILLWKSITYHIVVFPQIIRIADISWHITGSDLNHFCHI